MGRLLVFLEINGKTAAAAGKGRKENQKIMAGMLPGVELARRRKAHKNHQHNSADTLVLRPRIAPNFVSSALDDTALKARSRLEERLRGGGSRWNKHQASKDGEAEHAVSSTKSSMGMMMVEKVRSFDRKKAEKQVCAVCLEEIRAKQLVTSLPCSHRYHSECLLPWLNSHSHCPYCRTNVPS